MEQETTITDISGFHFCWDLDFFEELPNFCDNLQENLEKPVEYVQFTLEDIQEENIPKKICQDKIPKQQTIPKKRYRGKQHRKCPNIAHWLLEKLGNSKCENLIQWSDESIGEFKIVDQKGLAKLWANRPKKNQKKLSADDFG